MSSGARGSVSVQENVTGFIRVRHPSLEDFAEGRLHPSTPGFPRTAFAPVTAPDTPAGRDRRNHFPKRQGASAPISPSRTEGRVRHGPDDAGVQEDHGPEG